MKARAYIFMLAFITLIVNGCEKEEDNVMVDQNGNTYKTVKIGTQTWMAEDLKATSYRDGSPIPYIGSNEDWISTTSGGYCFNEFNSVLYNWYAVDDIKKLAPLGWHIPSEEEWDILINYLGGSQIAGGKMKATRTWKAPNTGATNESGFTALPNNGRYSYNGSITYVSGAVCQFWSSTRSEPYAWYYYLYWDTAGCYIWYSNKKSGMSVRCVKD